MSDGIILRGNVRPSLPPGDQLMRGLILMRANMMHIIRLQLAMERGDRRVALQTVDELVALDTKIRDLVETDPAAGAEIRQMQREVDEQRLSLSLEKLALAAGIRSRSPRTDQTWIEPAGVAARADGFSADRPAVIDDAAIDAAAIYPAGIESSVDRVAEAEEDALHHRPLRMLMIAGLVIAFSMSLGAIAQRYAGSLIADWLAKGVASWPM